MAPPLLEEELEDELLEDELLLELDELPELLLTAVPLDDEDDVALERLVPELDAVLWLPDDEAEEEEALVRPVLLLDPPVELPAELRPVDDPVLPVAVLDEPGTHLPWLSQTTPAAWQSESTAHCTTQKLEAPLATHLPIAQSASVPQLTS